ncbi:MAG: SpoIID/LytB domain-containing protein [Planctomycetes bacterium]|nr:SpoIID/LytB domain-containing protein [Planctomycetota bacterium]
MASTELTVPIRPRPTVWIPVFLIVFAGAASTGHRAGAEQTLASPSISVRDVRVRLAADATRVRVRSDAMIQVADPSGPRKSPLDAESWHVFTSAGRAIRCGDRRFAADGVTLHTGGYGSMTVAFDRGAGWSPSRRYPGRVDLRCLDDGTLEVINAVDVEQYVSSVVAHEIWPTFEREAYRAQAIAARTYVLYAMIHRRNAAYDVKAGQGSQVYRGIRADDTGRQAAEAAWYTRGIVSTWGAGDGGRLFSAFYSAVCGGVTQSAARFGDEHDIKPLSGGAKCDFCKDAPGETYRWGPVRIDKNELRSRLVARNPKAGFSGSITKIEVIDRSPQGRPIKLEIIGSTGKPLELSAESFRLAVGAERMRSTDCTIRVTKRHIVIENGRGFGHGIGLCQWGSQGLAQRGKAAAEILCFYYPGSRLARAY